MKIRIGILLFLAIIISISGCSQINNSANDKQNMIKQMDPAKNEENENRGVSDKLGFVRYTKEEVNNEAANNYVFTINKELKAHAITNMILRSEGFEEVATLVTDQDVLIAYEINGDIEADLAADIAKQSAITVMPRYFDIYVSDHDVLIKDIHSLHNSSTENKNYQQTIDKIIKEMQQVSDD